MNSASTLGPNKWYEEDPERRSIFHPDNVIISFRKANVVAIIDKSSGSIVWRLGPYFEEKPGAQHQCILRHNVPRPLDQISGQHNPHMISKGLPGAGNILLFDCQGGAGYPPASLGIYAGSRILEIDPITKQNRLAIYGGRLGLTALDFLQLICEQCAASAERQYSDHGGHAGAYFPDYT